MRIVMDVHGGLQSTDFYKRKVLNKIGDILSVTGQMSCIRSRAICPYSFGQIAHSSPYIVIKMLYIYYL